MKFATKITAMMAMAVAGVAETKVRVCLEEQVHIPAPILMGARGWATTMFHGAGVGINWTCTGAADSRTPLVITLTSQAPHGYKSGAIAYALPCEGVHIVVFYDRIENALYQHGETLLLGYVLVHEITHILQGVSHHSETGVMKATWGSDDYARIMSHQLTFAPEDIEMIQSGLGRTGRCGDSK